MKERIEFMGGDLNIKSRPGEGTMIDIRIPFTCPVPMDSHHEYE
jgi:chemotaxis protein histidine kinase CheA